MYRASISSYKSSNSPIRARDSYFFSSSPQKTPSNKISTSVSHHHKETSGLSIGPLTPKSPITSSKLAHMKMSSTLPSFQRPLPDRVNARETGKNQDTPLPFNRKESQLGVLFHLEKPHYLTDAARADVLFRQEFATQRKKPEHDDAIDVRKLDEWQMTFGRSKNHISLTKPTDLMEQYKTKNKQHKEKERKDFPSVRQDILNKIICLPDEDDLLGVRNNHNSRLPSIMDNQMMVKRSDSLEPKGNEIRAGARSLEVMQRENNKDILNDLINKKIREFIRTINVDEMTEEQLRVHVKKVAEGVVAQFKTLKGPTGSFIVHNCVESTVKALKSKKQDAELLFADIPKTKNKQENVGMDYEMMEDLLMGKFESCVQDEEDFRDKVKQLTAECYNYKKEMMAIQHQIDEINQKYGVILTEEAPQEDKLNTAVKNIARRYGMTLMDMQAKKAEKQFELNDYFKKQNLIKEKIAATQQAIQIRENDIEVSRSQKDYYRTQLRDLYYKCLKDDVALVKEKKNPMSYAWVIRSLWRIHEETKESAFPSFLDSTSIKFIIEYAKAQDELEDYCKVNNIMNLISNVEDFRCLSKHIDSSHFNGPESMDQNSSASIVHPQQFQKPQVRDLETMMEYVKDQMTALKRVNLRAKRQVPVGRHAFKAKGIVYKWEEVDPNQIDRIISHQPDQGSYDLTSDGQRSSKIEGDHHQIAWDIGHEKLKALMASRKKELDRLFKQNIGKELDERLKSNLLKAFNFLFGKIGPETHTRFLREKTVYEQNAQGKAKKASMSNNPYIKSPGSTSVPASPMSINTTKLPFGQSLFASSFYNEPSSPLSPGKFSALPTSGSFMQDDFKESALSIPRNDFDVTRNSGNWLAVPGSGTGLKKNSSTSRI